MGVHGDRTLYTAMALLLAGALAPARAATPPSGFVDSIVVDPTFTNGASVPVAIAYEPGSGALFVLEKGGSVPAGSARVRRRDPATGVVSTALTLTCVDSVGERGLLGIAFDPDYLAGSRFVYLYYTRADLGDGSACDDPGQPTGSTNRVVRFQESGGVLSGELLLLAGPVLGATNHQGGSVRFGLDKTLYISMGDNDTDADPLPASRDMNDLRGKILRIHRDGSIPAGNPFIGQPGKRPEIWAWGLRNPFRISIDGASGTLFIGDVGEGTWEEIDIGIAGADYGWPCFEASMPFRSCTPPPSGDVKPVHAYGRLEGASVTAGPVYHGGAFPPEYEGRFFFGDYVADWIRHAAVAADGSLSDVTPFMTDAINVVDMAVSPAGCLTWVSIGAQGVHDTCYTGGSNTAPHARSSGSPLSGLAPLHVEFDGTASSDADDDPLDFLWDFGDGTTGSAAAPSKTYATAGVREVLLTVDDGTGAPNATDAAPPLHVVVGNRSPQGVVTAPASGSSYSAGETIHYAGTGSDPEDGALSAPSFSWTVVFHHDQHTHPFLGPLTGASSGSFVVPTSGEDATDVFYRIEMTVTDSGSPLGAAGKLSHTAFADVVPRLTTITAAASPPAAGLLLEIDHERSPAPATKPTVVGFPRMITAPSPQTSRGATWVFTSWSDGGAADHVVSPPPAPTTYTATYQCTAGCNFTPALTIARVAPGTARLQWAPLLCALSYDVVRGGLSTLRSSSGSFTLATAACVADDTALATIDDATPPPLGGLWYLVRAHGCGFGSYDETGVPSQPSSRDAEIAASGNGCP